LSAEAFHVVTGIRFASCPQDVRIGHGRRARDPRGSVETGDVVTIPLAGQLGHGITASLRRRPVRVCLPVLPADGPLVKTPDLTPLLPHGREG
jgi:hypothetical protein